VTLLVDTSVWSLAFRRDTPPDVPQVGALRDAIAAGELLVTTGLIVLELLRGFMPARTGSTLAERLSALTLVDPRKDDYFAAAELINTCRRRGVQLGTVDALIAQVAIAHDLTLLTTDRDFDHAAGCVPLRLWR